MTYYKDECQKKFTDILTFAVVEVIEMLHKM